MKKLCVLDESKVCDNCGRCNMCDLDPNKVCDNCMKCLKMSEADYGEIIIDDVSETDDEMKQLLQVYLKSKEKKGDA